MTHPTPTRDQMTVADVAHFLRREADVIEQWLRAGHLPGYALPDDRWLIMRDDLAAFLAAHRHVEPTDCPALADAESASQRDRAS